MHDQSRYARGLAQLNQIDATVGAEVVAPLGDLGRYIIEVAFGDIYSRDGLSLRDRALATGAMLTALGGREPQLRVHLGAALNVGLISREPEEVIIQSCVLATAGAALFLTDGLIGLAVFPALAAAAPDLLMATGAMNQGSVLVLFVVIAATNLVGQASLGLATLRAGTRPRVAAVLVPGGGLLSNLPPGPVPFLALVLGGVLWSAGAVWLGLALRAQAHNVPAPGRATLGPAGLGMAGVA